MWRYQEIYNKGKDFYNCLTFHQEIDDGNAPEDIKGKKKEVENVKGREGLGSNP